MNLTLLSSPCSVGPAFSATVQTERLRISCYVKVPRKWVLMENFSVAVSTITHTHSHTLGRLVNLPDSGFLILLDRFFKDRLILFS